MKNYKKKMFKTKEEWLNFKDKTIGGSELACIFNQSKWGNAQDVYNKILLNKRKKVKETKRMREGTLAEENIRALFALDHQETMYIKNPPQKGYAIYQRKDKPYITCTPDGFAIEKTTGNKWGLEIKDIELRRNEDVYDWESDVLPAQYYFQCLDYLMTMNDLVGVILTAHLKYYKFDENTQEQVFDKAVDKSYYIYRKDVENHLKFVEEKVTNFWNTNILKHKRPKFIFKFK